MSTFNIIPLHQKPEFSPTCAAWSFGEWGCYIDDSSLKKSVASYQRRAQNTEKIPLTWITLDNNKIVGMIGLKEYSHDDRKDLSPWLGSLFIHPEFRRKGYATALIQNLHQESKNLGYKNIYLFTPDATTLYEKNGWRIIGKVRDPRGLHEHETLMKIEL
jgi:N-acetylglutamate synthase-like GNAT family acetyltransferase